MWNDGHVTPSANDISITLWKLCSGIRVLANVSIHKLANLLLAMATHSSQAFMLQCYIYIYKYIYMLSCVNSWLLKIAEEELAVKKKMLSLPVSAKRQDLRKHYPCPY